MLTSLSQCRLRETASLLKSFSTSGKEFSVLRSNTTSPIAQYYIVSADWESYPPTMRIEPLAHLNVTRSGKVILQTWQPEFFEVNSNEQHFLSEFKKLTH